MKPISKLLAIMTIGLCTALHAAYGEDTVIIDLQQQFTAKSEKLGKKLEAYHDTAQAREETKHLAKEAREAPAGSSARQLAHAKYVEARLAEIGPRIQFLSEVRGDLPELQTTIQLLGDALDRQKAKLGLSDSADPQTLQKTKKQLTGMLAVLDQLGNDPAIAGSARYQQLLGSFTSGIENFTSRRNDDVFNTKELDKLSDSLDMSRMLIEEAWMRLENDYNRLKAINLRGNTSAVMAYANKALSQLPGYLNDDPAADEARNMDQGMYETSAYEYQDAPAKGHQFDSKRLSKAINDW